METLSTQGNLSAESKFSHIKYVNASSKFFCFIGNALSVANKSNHQRCIKNPVKHDGAFFYQHR